MPYYLKHPEHGTHICYTLQDVEAHKAIGWVPLEDRAFKVGEKITVAGVPPFNGEFVVSERKKPGRKPKAK